MQALIALFLLLTTNAPAHLNCNDVESASNFSPQKHGQVLVTYMNFTKAKDDGERFGVCRIFSDGHVITSFGCGGTNTILKEKIKEDTKTQNELLELLTLPQLNLPYCNQAFEEHFYETNGVYFDRGYLPMFAIDRDEELRDHKSEQHIVRHNSKLEKLVRRLCPLDYEPTHGELVRPSRRGL